MSRGRGAAARTGKDGAVYGWPVLYVAAGGGRKTSREIERPG